MNSPSARGTDPSPTFLADAQQVCAALEMAGWRPTRQRQAVYAYLKAAADDHHHPTAEQVYQAVKAAMPGIGLATVYKALEALVASGLVTRLSCDHGPARFDARCEGHYHLRCLRTGQVEDLPTPYDPGLLGKLDPALASRLRAQGFHLTGYRLELVGYFEDSHGCRSDPK